MVESYGTLREDMRAQPGVAGSRGKGLRVLVAGILLFAAMTAAVWHMRSPLEPQSRPNGPVELLSQNAKAIEHVKAKASHQISLLETKLNQRRKELQAVKQQLIKARAAVQSEETEMHSARKRVDAADKEQDANSNAETTAQALAESARNDADEAAEHSKELFRNAKDTHADALKREHQVREQKLKVQKEESKLDAIRKHSDQLLQMAESRDKQSEQLLAQAKQLRSKAQTLAQNTVPHDSQLAAKFGNDAHAEIAKARRLQERLGRLRAKSHEALAAAGSEDNKAQQLNDAASRLRLQAASDVDTAHSLAQTLTDSIHKAAAVLGVEPTSANKYVPDRSIELHEGKSDQKLSVMPGAHHRIHDSLESSNTEDGKDTTDYSTLDRNDGDAGESLESRFQRDTGGPMQALDDDNEGVKLHSTSSSDGSNDNTELSQSTRESLPVHSLVDDRNDVPNGDKSELSDRDMGNSWQSLDDDNDGIYTSSKGDQLKMAKSGDELTQVGGNTNEPNAATETPVSARSQRRMNEMAARFTQKQYNWATGEYGSPAANI